MSKGSETRRMPLKPSAVRQQRRRRRLIVIFRYDLHRRPSPGLREMRAKRESRHVAAVATLAHSPRTAQEVRRIHCLLMTL